MDSETVKQAERDFRQSAAEYYEEGRKKMAEWEGQVVDYVRNEPVKALLVVAGVGVLLGMLLRRR